MCDFLLVINSNLGPISHRLTAIHPIAKLSLCSCRADTDSGDLG